MPSVGGKKNFQSFTVICRKPHVLSSICLRATIFQNPEGTLWTHCIITSYPSYACYMCNPRLLGYASSDRVTTRRRVITQKTTDFMLGLPAKSMNRSICCVTGGKTVPDFCLSDSTLARKLWDERTVFDKALHYVIFSVLLLLSVD
jgi:hypothetical protein